MTATEKILHAITEGGGTVKAAGLNRWMATCPNHDDKTPSLRVTKTADSALLNCFAGCEKADVMLSLHMSLADLFNNPKGAQYQYVDAAGLTTRTVTRSLPKTFSQKVTEKGISPLFHLAEVVAAVNAGKDIYITEGEKDVLAAEAIGATATTSPGGAASWKGTDYSPLTNANHIIVVADRDEAGLKRAGGLSAYLKTFVVGKVSVVGACVGKDMADHVAAGHSVNELVPMVISDPKLSRRTPGQELRRKLVTPAASIRTEQQVFFWEGRIPASTISIFAGRGGEGKSTFAFWLAALTTRGLVEGTWSGTPQPTLIWSGEDRWETIIIPRLKAAGANLDLVFKLGIESVLDEETLQASPNFPQDLHLVQEAIVETGAKLVMFDPITSTMSGDLNKVADTRRTFDGLARIAHETGAVILCVMHFNKGAGNVSEKLSGSHAFRDASRSVFLFATDEETGNRVLSQDKNNYAEGATGSLAFTLESVDISTDDGNVTSVARVIMQGESDVSVSDLLKRGADNTEDTEDRNVAQAFVVGFIKSRSDWEAEASEVLKAGRAAGFNENEIKNARSRCKSPRISSGRSAFGGGWVWAISDQGVTVNAQGVQGITLSGADTLDALGPISDALGTTHNLCQEHQTPTHKGMCGRCEAAK
jgi:hypothetical protein